MMRTRRALIFIISIFVLMLISFVLMSQAINNSDRFNQYYFVLLILNSLGLLGLVYLITGNIRLLLKQLRDRQPGSRLTLRMVTTFITLAVVPLLIVYWFSTDFIRRGIDTWFDVRVEEALTDSLNLSKESLGLRMRELLKSTELIAEELADTDSRDVVIEPLSLSGLQGVIDTIVMNEQDIDTRDLDTLRLRSGAEELAVMTDKGRIIATSSANTDIIPNVPGKSTLLQLSQGRNYIGLEPIRDAGLFIRAVAKIPGSMNNKTRLVQALYPIATHINELAENVQAAYAKYQELAYLRKPLQLSFTMTLTLVLLFSIFSAVLAAFHSARKLASPIQDLAEGTRRISKGDYGKQLPLHGHDDLGFLVKSFNEMSNQIANAQNQLDEQRGYLQAVLSNLSSGVLTLDADLKLITVNQTASQILKVDLTKHLGQTFQSISSSQQFLKELYDNILPDLHAQHNNWQKQVVLFGTEGRQILMCRGTALDAQTQHGGHVIVFDDVTALIQGQRDAAWSEVARRLAHEIKNPLTPIQLSAERLRHKYLNKMDADEANTLDRMTNTIIQQVSTMKEMVNAFSDYARPPQIRPELLAINPMIEEVSSLYQEMDKRTSLELDLDPDLPRIEADQNRLRQILNNLIKNAIEATHEVDTPVVTLRTSQHRGADRDYIELQILDNGPGFPDDLLGEIFEPYVTTKKRGTGLGLAIVKKIVEEHGGIVWVENTEQGGTVRIRLPVMMERHNVHSINEARKNIV